MKLSVSDTAKLTGISVRTLHYYDEIGLFGPTFTTEAGYRFYDEEALAVLQEILFYRELEFPLKEIKNLLSMPDRDRQETLKAQRELLVLKRLRLERLIDLVDQTMKGGIDVSFKEFDQSEITAAREKYAREAKERWGESDAYKESEKRTSGYGEADWKKIFEETDEIFNEFAACVREGCQAEDARAQELVRRWKDYITAHYYQCTDEILAGLGKMYAGDGRFAENINQAGAGTAEFMSRAIAAYCKGN